MGPLAAIAAKSPEIDHEAFLKASAMLTTAALSAARDGINVEMLALRASFFLSAGIPVCDASTVFRFPVLWPRRLEIPERPDLSDTPMNTDTFLIAVTQRRSLAKLTGLTEREAESWAMAVSLWFFRSIAQLSAKVDRRKASPQERDAFGYALVGLLFVCELRCTHFLRAAQRIIFEIHPEEVTACGKSKLGICLGGLTDYVVTLSERRLQAQLWARNWLRRLYGDTASVRKAGPVIAFWTDLSSMGVGPDYPIAVDRDGVENDAVRNETLGEVVVDGGVGGEEGTEHENAAENATEENEGYGDTGEANVDARIGGICTILTMFAKHHQSPNTVEDLRRELNILACKDLTRLFSLPPQLVAAFGGVRFGGRGIDIGSLGAMQTKQMLRNALKMIHGPDCACENPGLTLFTYRVRGMIL